MSVTVHVRCGWRCSRCGLGQRYECFADDGPNVERIRAQRLTDAEAHANNGLCSRRTIQIEGINEVP